MKRTLFATIAALIAGTQLTNLAPLAQAFGASRGMDVGALSRNGGRRPSYAHVKRVAAKKRNQARHRAAVRRAKA